ncbi:MAG TPA: hypothetical protein V6D00_14960 [Pantanalinema sp.]
MKHPGRLALILGLALGAFPHGALAAPPQAITLVREIRYEPSESAIYLPFEGPRAPMTSISHAGKSVVLDIPRADFPFAELYAQIENSPLLSAFVAAFDPEIQGLHLVIEGRVPLLAEPDPAYRGVGIKLLIAPRDPRRAGAMRPTATVLQRVTVVPRGGGHARPFAPAAKAGPAWEFPAPSLGYAGGPTSERYTPQALIGGADWANRFSLSWEPGMGDYGVPLRLGYGGYRYDDPDYAGVTHRRSETSVAAALSRRYAMGPLQGSTGFGYRATFTRSDSSQAVASPTLFFAGSQLFHGPLLRQSLRGQVVGPLGVGLDLEWVPYAFAHIDDGTRMPWLTAFRVEPRLSLWPDQRVTLGYFYERTMGDPFHRESSGVTLGMSFSGF